jgi:hypothetical protein
MATHRKPIGETGPIRVTHTEGDPLVTWLKIRFPTDKAAQELLIALTFAKELNASEGTNWTVEQLREDDFDFVLHSTEERRYLELQEIIIPPAKRGSPYFSREQVIHSGKFSDTIISAIGRKSAKYSRTLGTPLDLLVYATHWRFQPNQMVPKLVAYHLRHTDNPFTRVYQLVLLDEGTGTIEKLFPNDQLLQGFDYAGARATRYANFDPIAGQSVKNPDGSIGVGFTLGSEALKKLRGS